MISQLKLIGTVEITEAKTSPDNVYQEKVGGLLEAFHQPDGYYFQEWLVITRERQRYQTVLALRAQCESCAAEKQYALGIKLARYWLKLDPLNEEPLRCLMNLLVYDGRPHDALRRYERYEWWLSAELAIEPEPKTQALAGRIGVGVR